MQLVRDWFKQRFNDPQVLILIVFLVAATVAVIVLGKMLAPLFAAAIIAYLLESVVSMLEQRKMPRLAAVIVVYLLFLIFFVIVLVALVPLLFEQLTQFFQRLPQFIAWLQRELLLLPERYPDFVSEKQIRGLMDALLAELTSLGQRILSLSAASIRTIFIIVLYLFLVPILVFFSMKDKSRILAWLGGFLPPDRTLIQQVWHEVDLQIGNYIRGKVWEIGILWIISFFTFTIFGLQFAMLISFFIGLSVLVPFIGAPAMAIPVALVGFSQWGWSSDLAYALIAYIAIQILDGNLLAPLLFSGVVNLHPLAIIAAILVFGGVWGFWGVFFAIPLATLVQAVLNALSGKNFGQTGANTEDRR